MVGISLCCSWTASRVPRSACCSCHVIHPLGMGTEEKVAGRPPQVALGCARQSAAARASFWIIFRAGADPILCGPLALMGEGRRRTEFAARKVN